MAMARSKGRKNAQQNATAGTPPPDRPEPSQATPHDRDDRPASPAPSNATTADDDDMDDFEDAQGGDAASRAGGSDAGDDEPEHGQVGSTRDNGSRDSWEGVEGAGRDAEERSSPTEGAGDDAQLAVDRRRSGDGDDSGHSSPDRAPTPTLSSTNQSSATATTAGRTSSPPTSRPTSVASSSGIEGLRQGANRLSLALSDDSAGERGEGSVTGDAESPSKRPFSLSSAPETPTSPSASSSSAPNPPALPRHRSSLLASSLSGPAQDPTNVGREASASLTQAVWRQSLGLNASPGAKGLVDVVLSDNEEEADGTGDGEPSTPRRKGANGKRRSVRSSSADGDDDSHYGDEDLDDADADESRDSFPSPSAHSPAKFSSSANPRFPRTSAHLMPSSPSRDRQGSIATPHAADGFISHRASTNLSSAAAPESAAAPKASNGIQKLQNQFLKVKEQEGGEGGAGAEGIDWDFWGRVMNDYEEVARTQRESRRSRRGASRGSCVG